MAKKLKVFKQIAAAYDRATVTAMNRAARSALSATIKYIRKDYNIRAKDLRKEYHLRLARRGHNYITIIAWHKAIGLKLFSARQTVRPRKYGTGRVGGTKVTVKRGQRRKITHAFIATMKSGHKGVFMRTGDNGKIVELFGPSAEQLLSMHGSLSEIEKNFFKLFEKEFDSKLKYYLQKI